MRRLGVLSAAVLLGGLGAVLLGAERPPADYQKAMQNLGAAAQNLDKAIAAEKYDDVAKFASSSEAAFVVAEAYWKDRAPDALAFATSGEKFAADLGAMATLKSKEGVQYATKQMTSVCSECHDAHRQRQDDGTFQIK